MFSPTELKTLFTHEMSRRDFLLDTVAAGSLAALGLSLPQTAYSREINIDTSAVRIGYLPISDATALLVADAYELFQKQGLKVEKPIPVGSWSELIIGFLSGKFNLVHLLNPIPIWLRYSHQIPIKVTSWAHVNGSAILVGEHTGIEHIHQLAGKQIAVPYWYSIHNILLQMILRQAGLKPVIKNKYEHLDEKEVNLQILPPPLMVQALKLGNIDAFIVAEPINSKGELVAKGKILRFTGDVWKNHPCCVICMHEQLTTQQPEWVQKVTNALVQAQVYTQKNREEVAHTLSKSAKGYIPVDEKVLKHAMMSYDANHYALPKAILHQKTWGNRRIDFYPWPYPSATRLLVESMKKTLVGNQVKNTFLNTLDPNFVAEDLVDYRFVKVGMENHMDWETVSGVDLSNPYAREEIIAI